MGRVVCLFLCCAHSLCGQPPWTYTTYLGGPGNEFVTGVGSDGEGNTYVGGRTGSLGFPFAPVENPGYSSSLRDGFLFKLSRDGALLFAKTIRSGQVMAMLVDSAGNAYLAGDAGAEFETTPDVFQPRSPGNRGGAFVMKVSPEGATIFSTFLTGEFRSGLPGTITVDADGNPIVCGGRAGPDYPLTDTALQKTTERASPAGYCSQLSSDGRRLLFSTLFGGSGQTYPMASATDSSGNLIVAGSTDSKDFPLVNAFQAEDTRRTLFRYDAEAAAWTAVGDASTGGVLGLQFGAAEPERLFVSTSREHLESADGGLSWRRYGGPSGSLVVHPLNRRFQCVFGNSLQLWVTTDGGSQWRPAGIDLAPQVIADLGEEGSFYVRRSQRIERWRLAHGLSVESWSLGSPSHMAIDFSAEKPVLWAADLFNLYRSTEDRRFERVADNVSRVFLAPGAPPVLYVQRAARRRAEDPIFARSDDGGRVWTPVGAGLDGIYSSLVIDPNSPMKVYMATTAGVYHSADGGETWIRLEAGMGNGFINTLEFDPAGRLWAGAAQPDHGFVAKINLAHPGLEFSSWLTGTGGGTATAVALDEQGRIVVAGSTGSPDFLFTGEPLWPAGNPFRNGFVTILGSSGNLESSRLAGAPVTAVALRGGRLHLGFAVNGNQIFSPGVQVRGQFQGGFNDGVLGTLDLLSGQLLQANYLGGANSDWITALAVGPDDRVRAAGNTSSDDFPVSAGALQGKRGGSSPDMDGFLAIAPTP